MVKGGKKEMGNYKRVLLALVLFSMLMLLATPFIAMAYTGHVVKTAMPVNFGVGSPFQRQTFFANGTHYVFYVNSTSNANQTGYMSTTNNGTSWNSFKASGNCTDQNDFGIWFDGSLVHLVRATNYTSRNRIIYKRGIPLSNGTIIWDTENVAKYGITNVTWSEPSVAVNSTNDIMIACTNTTVGVLAKQICSEVSLNLGSTWISPTYPSFGVGNTTHSSLCPLANDRFYLGCAYTGGNGTSYPRGFLWSGTAYGTAERPVGVRQMESSSWYSMVAIGNNVYLTWSSTNATADYNLYFTWRDYATGNSSWTTNMDTIVDDELIGALSQHYDGSNLMLTLIDNSSGPIYLMSYTIGTGTWSALTTKESGTAHTTSDISAAYSSYSPVGFVWLDGAGPYNLNYDYYFTPSYPSSSPIGSGAAGDLARLMPLIFAAIVITALVGAMVAVSAGADLVLTFIMAAIGAVVGVAMIGVISSIVSNI